MRLQFIASAASIWMLATPSGGSAQTPPVFIAHPKWDAVPTPDAITRSYPAEALSLHQPGDARLSCKAKPDGQIASCAVVNETPKGFGFGEAAKSLMPLLRMQPVTDRSAGAPDRITTITIKYRETGVVKAGDGSLLAIIVDWDATPTPEEVAKAAPSGLVSGRAMLTCQVGDGGYLKVCRVTSETPAGRGVGEAAMTLTPLFRTAQSTDAGVPLTGFNILMSIQFGKPAAAPPAAAPSP